MDELEQRLRDIRVLKGSICNALDTLAVLKKAPGDNHSEQRHARLRDIKYYLGRWDDLAKGTYIPEQTQAD
jgi:hypothetical protein